MKRIPKKKMLAIEKSIKQAVQREEFEYDRYINDLIYGKEV